jgi:hypothetical protein
LDHLDFNAGVLVSPSMASVAAQTIQNVVPASASGAATGSRGTISFLSDDGATAPSLPAAVEVANVPVEAVTIPSGASITQMTTNSDGSISEAVAFAGNNISFNNSFASGVSNAFINCALNAEQLIASQWTTPKAITLNESFTAQAEGQNGQLASNGFYVIGVSYATLKGALTTLSSHEPGNTYLQQAIAHLPASDPSGGVGFELALPYARMLGLTSASNSPEDVVTLNSSYDWSYGQDVTNTLLHEISEGGLGRIGGLSDQNSLWSVMDLFRYNSSGVADYTDGRNGRTTYFSYDGGATLSSLSYNNEYSGGTHVNGGDTADFTQVDVFGTGFPGETNALSQTDLQIMEALGWTLAGQGPVVSASTAYLSTTSVAASSLFTVSDPNGLSVTNYAFNDIGPGHLVLNGVTEPDNTEIDITASQLSQLVYQSVPGTADTLQVRAEDSLAWGGWTSFRVIAPQIVIQVDTNSFGLTKLAEVGGQYALENSGGNGPHLELNGTPVLAGQLSPWTPMGAAPTATGYEVAWKLGSSFLIWNTDSNGNYLSGSGALSGSSVAVETYELSFNQDLNGDGKIGVTSTVIESNGTTSLVVVGDQYALEDSHGNGPHLQLNGAPVVAGELSPWAPVAAAQTASGYVVAWQLGNSFLIWTADSNGSYLSGSGGLSGASTALENYETVFNHDLNGDGTIGVTSMVIESNGTTSLVAVADQYALEDSQGNGPHLQINGAPVVAGQFSPWVPVAATRAATGYDVAWQLGSSFLIWNTDSNGNYLSGSGALSATSTALENFEIHVNRDLNGDGTIGVKSTVVESNGTTSLVAVADQYALEDSHGNGPHLQLNGTPIVAGELNPWTPVAAAQTAKGYVVAWQLGSSFVIWNTDSSGNYLSGSGSLSGTSATLENYETVFNHDLNGDGTIGVPPGGGAPLAASAAATVLNSDSFSFHEALNANATVRTLPAGAGTAGAAAAIAAADPDAFNFHQDFTDHGLLAVHASVSAQSAAAPVWPFSSINQIQRSGGVAGGSPEPDHHPMDPASVHFWHFDVMA